jgi:DNA-binding LacI/PurR family transcriptional regulator
MSALQEAQLSIKPEHFVRSDYSMEGGQRAAYQMMQNDELPGVIIALNDLMAIGAILALQEAGYRVPEDVAVMGYDDIPEARLIRPALTTIAQDSVDLGRKLAHCLFERIANPDLSKRFLDSSQTLIKRDSA